MKYIKLFENKLYHKISGQELLKRRNSNNFEDFKPYEISWLKEFLKTRRGIIIKSFNSDYIEFYFTWTGDRQVRYFLLHKLSDNYFTVVLDTSVFALEFFECDEFEGLKQLLSDKLKPKHNE